VAAGVLPADRTNPGREAVLATGGPAASLACSGRATPVLPTRCVVERSGAC